MTEWQKSGDNMGVGVVVCQRCKTGIDINERENWVFDKDMKPICLGCVREGEKVVK